MSEKSFKRNIIDITKKMLIFVLIIFVFLIINVKFENYKINLRNIALIKGKNFINKNLKGILFKNKAPLSNFWPKISVIIPVYNSENSIKSSVRSVQNQNMDEIEIILVNDLSKDNSLKIIKEMKNEDNRIKIINNEKNMGTLYSRCIGVLQAKGKYILALDNDDMFLDEDVFEIIYKEAEKKNFDIIGFKAIDSPSYNASINEFINNQFHEHKNNLILHQPELGIFPISKNGNYFPNDFHIWGKCIRTNIYIKSINAMGIKRYSTFMSWHEDTVMVFIIFNFSKTFKFIGKYGIFHLISERTASFTQSKDNIMFGEIFFLDIIYDFSKNNIKDKKIVAEKAIELKDLKLFNITNNKNKNYLKNVLIKILNCKYISEKYKNSIMDKYIELLIN